MQVFSTKLCVFVFLCLSWARLTAQSAGNAVWQWSVPADGHLDHNTDTRAYLWVPERCGKIRGFVLAQNNMEEQMILENPVFRRAMADLGFAEIWVSPFFDHLFRFNEGAGDIFNTMVDDLATVSGYPELRYAPVVPLGHSAAASWPYYFAVWNPGRTLAAISVSGQWPYFRSPVFAPDIWAENQHIDFIPSLETMGEYENADSWATEGLKERAEHPYMPLSMLACPGEGHFASTDKKAAYLALYIKKAADYRLPEPYPVSGAPVLRPIDPTRSGWLVPRWRRDRAFNARPAPVAAYKGDPAEAFWFFDEQMAKVTVAYETAERGKKPSFVEYIQNNLPVPLKETHQLVDLAFEPGADGISFALAARFADTVSGESAVPAIWTKLAAGHRLGHADNGIPVKIQPIWGPVAQYGNEFAVQFKRGMRVMGGHLEAWFLAWHPGDGQYKPVSLQAKMDIPLENKEGPSQEIYFDSIPDQKTGTASVRLHGYSSAGLPVHYFVREGPAVIKDSTLIFTEVPPKARFPVEVTVVAWQYGLSSLRKVRTAKQVTHSFKLIK